jgi:hypothetical protein
MRVSPSRSAGVLFTNRRKEWAMNWDCIEGNWKQLQGNVLEK